MPAVVVGGLIAAGGSIASAAIGAHAAGKAADQQQAAGNKALDLQTQQFQAGQQALAPFQAAPGSHPIEALNYHVGTQPQNGGTLGALANYGASGGGGVLLQAPTGETRRVPSNQVQSYVARGAKVIG